jgi:hypothetical protein
VESVFPYGKGAQGECFQVWEIKYWVLILEEAAVGNEGYTEGRSKAEHRQWQRIIKPSDPDVDLLKIIKGWGPEPAIKVSKVEAVEVEAAYRALVLGENLCYNFNLLGTIPTDMCSVKVKRSRAPQVTPAARKGRSAHGIVRAEERDDDAEYTIWEEAEKIDSIQFHLL